MKKNKKKQIAAQANAELSRQRNKPTLNVITIVKQCEKELKDFPIPVREDLADALAMLDEGINLSMPLSRPMPSIGKGVHELRLKDRSGIYRVVYFIRKQSEILLIHAFQKKSQQTPKENIELAKQRLKGVL